MVERHIRPMAVRENDGVPTGPDYSEMIQVPGFSELMPKYSSGKVAVYYCDYHNTGTPTVGAGQVAIGTTCSECKTVRKRKLAHVLTEFDVMNNATVNATLAVDEENAKVVEKLKGLLGF